MSPEQARGRPVDKRTDIWAFGVIVFEMLTGGFLFSGETVTDTFAAVLAQGDRVDPPAANHVACRRAPAGAVPEAGIPRSAFATSPTRG